MQDIVRAQDFSQIINESLDLVADEGVSARLVVKQVKEKESPVFPLADSESRTPFYVILKGSLDSSLPNSSVCLIKGLERGDLEGVHVSRILPESLEPSAWYQIIFN